MKKDEKKRISPDEKGHFPYGTQLVYRMSLGKGGQTLHVFVYANSGAIGKVSGWHLE